MLIGRKQIITTTLVGSLVLVNLALLFLQIHKQTRFVQLSYGRQRLEKEIDELERQRNEVLHQLHLQQSHKHVQQYVSKNLGLQNTSVKQLRRIVLPIDQERDAKNQ